MTMLMTYTFLHNLIHYFKTAKKNVNFWVLLPGRWFLYLDIHVDRIECKQCPDCRKHARIMLNKVLPFGVLKLLKNVTSKVFDRLTG